jgi:hypothetical protein
MEKPKEVKEPKPILLSVIVRDINTGAALCAFPPTKSGEKRAERYRGLAGLKIVKIYEKGGKKYESD